MLDACDTQTGIPYPLKKTPKFPIAAPPCTERTCYATFNYRAGYAAENHIYAKETVIAAFREHTPLPLPPTPRLRPPVCVVLTVHLVLFRNQGNVRNRLARYYFQDEGKDAQDRNAGRADGCVDTAVAAIAPAALSAALVSPKRIGGPRTQRREGAFGSSDGGLAPSMAAQELRVGAVITKTFGTWGSFLGQKLRELLDADTEGIVAGVVEGNPSEDNRKTSTANEALLRDLTNGDDMPDRRRPRAAGRPADRSITTYLVGVLAQKQKRAGGIIKHNTNAVKNLGVTEAVPGDNVDEGSSPEPPAKKAKQPAKPAAGVPPRGHGGAGARAGGGPSGSRAGRRAAVGTAYSLQQQAGRRGGPDQNRM
eukprot:jgi/Tetstr1/439540/TSEL_027969.t1